MAKDRERKAARILYVEQGKSAKDVAGLVGVAEKTVGQWVDKFGWKDARNAIATSKNNRVDNIKLIIDQFATDRLALQAQITDLTKIPDPDFKLIGELRGQIAAIDDGVSKWNKTLENLDKENKISLSVYLSVMERIFKSLQLFKPELFMQTIDFQEHHVNEISNSIG